MSRLCDLSLDEHAAGVCLAEPQHQAALKRRQAGAAAWSSIERSPARDFLEGKPIHCGEGLELQDLAYRNDDYGEYVVRLETGHRVRYELAWGVDRPKQIVLHLSVGGREFTTPWNEAMGLRWPVQR